jgi:hypothetical protein
VQVKSTSSRPKTGPLAPLALLAFLFLGGHAGAKDIGILLDRSLSVDEANRNEAVRLVCGLMSGSVDPELRRKWQLLETPPSESDPRQREARVAEIDNLRKLIGGEDGEGLARDSFQLFLGDFGDLHRIATLAGKNWIEQDSPTEVTKEVAQWATDPSIKSEDKETHYLLARATAASRLDQGDFYFFVITDEVEDLINLPVSYYLDEAKTKSAEKLKAGDFRDLENKKNLDRMNRKIQRGETVHRPGKPPKPGYERRHVKTLEAFTEAFEERRIARFTLRSDPLLRFFADSREKNRNKVPVSVYVYSARKLGKQELGANFTLPSISSDSSPYTLSIRRDTVRWSIKAVGLPDENYRSTMQAINPDGSPRGEAQVVTGDSQRVFELFPDLEDGIYELRLQVTHQDTGIDAVASAFIRVHRAAPVLSFRAGNKLKGTDSPEKNYRFLPEDGNVLDYGVEWEWSDSNGQTIATPDYIERTLDHFYNGPETQIEPSKPQRLEGTPDLGGSKLGALLTGGGAGRALIEGGLYRLTLTAAWDGGASKATTISWFTLPPANLSILHGVAGEGPSKASPLTVRVGDVIRISNWMHGWEDFRYRFRTAKQVEGAFNPIHNDDSPIKLITRKDGQCYFEVTSRFDGLLRYTVMFGPGSDSGASEEIEWPADSGYIEFESRSWLPWIMAALALLFLGFLGKGLLQSRRRRRLR